jgi:hypothetical protein
VMKSVVMKGGLLLPFIIKVILCEWHSQDFFVVMFVLDLICAGTDTIVSFKSAILDFSFQSNKQI